MFSPLTWIIFLLIFGYFFKRTILKRVAYGLAIIIFLIFSSPALYNLYARWYQPVPVHLQRDAGYSFGIVAGGFGSVDNKGEGYFNESSDRFIQTVKLYKEGIIKNILISGGNSKKNDNTFREADWVRQEMIAFGVPDSVIYAEDHSESTKDNASNSKLILDSLKARPPYVLITSAFHMPRAGKLFENAGIEIIPYPCNYTEGRGPFSYRELIPQISLLSDWSRYIREGIWMLVMGRK